MDSVLSQLGLCPRGEDGYLGGCDPEVPTSELGGRFRELESRLDQDGYVDGAVAVLRQAGYEAWRNCVGHIAFTPDQTG